MYYNVECELSRHRAVITVWDRPGFAAASPPPPPRPFLPHPPRSIQPRRPATGPDNERVITPRWPTAVLLGRAAFPRGDYYSFYSLARTRPLFRASPDYDPFDSATLLPSTHPRGARCCGPMCVAYKDRIVSFRALPLPPLTLRPFIPLRFTFSAFL